MSVSILKPDYGYVAYIDESGDDGLRRIKPVDKNGASEWLVLSCVVVSATREKEVLNWVKDIRIKMGPSQRRDLHFQNFNPAKKAIACSCIAELPVRCFIVAANKKNMRGYTNPDAAKIPSKNWFYCWLSRLLLERVTDFVATQSLQDVAASKLLKIEYSERGGLSYSQMGAYYEWLKMKSAANNLFLPMGDLRWEVMNKNLLEVYRHETRAGLQLADIVASAFFKACDYCDTGMCDPQFAQLLSPRMARIPDAVTGQVAGYGVKLMPSWRKAGLSSEQQKIFRYYGYPKQWWAPGSFSPRASSPTSRMLSVLEDASGL